MNPKRVRMEQIYTKDHWYAWARMILECVVDTELQIKSI